MDVILSVAALIFAIAILVIAVGGFIVNIGTTEVLTKTAKAVENCNELIPKLFEKDDLS